MNQVRQGILKMPATQGGCLRKATVAREKFCPQEFFLQKATRASVTCKRETNPASVNTDGQGLLGASQVVKYSKANKCFCIRAPKMWGY